MFDSGTLKGEEIAAYTLRSLYSRFGYTRYKMSKFEEYDLYVRNKDFLISDGIITFTDTNGRLLALKPDVTLSIIKNSKHLEGTTQKLYYDENVYRTGNSNTFKEIKQTGLECIGEVSDYDVCEVLYLALESLALIDENYILDLAHAGLFTALIKLCGLEDKDREIAVSAIADKNRDDIYRLYNDGRIDGRAQEILLSLIKNYKNVDELKEELSDYTSDSGVVDALEEFDSIMDFLKSIGNADKICIDFSIVSDTGYYSGVVFKGYIKDIPQSVLSGGRYDKLMKKMGKDAGAVGFAVYLDTLERHNLADSDYDYDYLLLKGENVKSESVIDKVNSLTKSGETVLVVSKIPENVRYRELLKI